MNIIQVLDDPSLLAPHFRGPTWTAWRSFLKALFALPMDDAALALYRHHTGRTEPPSAPFREAALIAGRRGGKSRILGLIAVFLACFHDFRPRLAPGEAATLAVIAADRRQARGIFRFISGMLRHTPMLAELVETETADTITLTNGVVIEIHTASFRVTRGYSLCAALCDEVAFWRSDESANPDTEILAALRPGLSNLRGLLLIASSPYSKRGALHQAFRENWGRDGARVLVWRGTTAELNPEIDPGIIAAAYEADAASASAEYGANFRDDITGFVAREVVDACTVPGRYELPRISANRYVAFVDPSGGSADAMTLAIAYREGSGDAARAVLAAIREVRPPFSPEATVEEFCKLLKGYGVSRVTGDRYAGEWPREQFRKHGISYDLADKAKSDLYRELLPILNSGRAELLDLPRLAAQFHGLERRVARGGRDSIDHPPGSHDDVVNAVAGALLACTPQGMSVMDRMRVLAS